jgi:DNA-binding ferritin-like protein
MNPQELFLKLVAQLRMLQVAYQAAHHNVKGSLFFQDHDALGGFYEALQGEYDRAAEKYVALYGPYNIMQVMQMVMASMQGMPVGEVKENKEYFTSLLAKEKEVSSMVDNLVRQGGLSEGTKNMVADIGTLSEGRQYLIKQRIK